MDSYDREMEQLEADYAAEIMTQAEFNQEMREMVRDYRSDALEAAENAYLEELDRW